MRSNSFANRFASSACFLAEGTLGITYLISLLQPIGDHDAAPYVVGLYQVRNALPAERHRSDNG
jgi:hypothetical protein